MRRSHYIALFFCSLFLFAGTLPGKAQEKNEQEKEKKEVSKYDRANAEYLLIEAQKFFLLEDYERTLAFLDQSLEVDDKNHAAYFKRAETYLVIENYDRGLNAIKKAQELKPDNKYYYILGAQLYKAKEDLNGAAQEYELMLSNTSDYKEFLLDIVDVYVELEDFDKALSTLEITEKEFGTPNKFMLQKKDLLVRAGRSTEAIDYLKTLLSSNSNNEELLTEYTALMSLNGRDVEVITYLESIESSSRNATPLLLQMYLRNRQFEKASTVLIKVLNDNALELEREIELAADLAALNNPESLRLFKSITEHLEARAPENTRVLEIKGQLLTLQGQAGDGAANANLGSETFEVLVKLKENDPSNFQNWKRVLDYEFEQGDWEALAKDAEESLDYFPNQGLFYFYAGSAMLYTGELEDAEDLLSQAQRLSLSNDSLKARSLGKLAELAFAQDQAEAAQKHFDEALATLRLPEIINNYSFQLALRQIAFGKAQELAEELIALNPAQLKSRMTLAFVHFQQGDFEQARLVIEAAMIQLPAQIDGPALEQYGDVLMKLNLVDAALEQWQKAKSLGKTSEKLDQKIANKEYF